MHEFSFQTYTVDMNTSIRIQSISLRFREIRDLYLSTIRRKSEPRSSTMQADLEYICISQKFQRRLSSFVRIGQNVGKDSRNPANCFETTLISRQRYSVGLRGYNPLRKFVKSTRKRAE